MMDNIYLLSDADITTRISSKLKELRLRQNISRQALSDSSGVSISSIARIEDGEIKSFDSFLRIIRTLGKFDILMPLLQEEEISPKEYFELMHSTNTKLRKRASKSNKTNQTEASEW